jgi:hypothetical protein
MSFWDSIGSVAKGLIEIGPLKIDNDTVEKVVGAGAVLIAGYATYKVLSDKSAAENVATVIRQNPPTGSADTQPSQNPKMPTCAELGEMITKSFGPLPPR